MGLPPGVCLICYILFFVPNPLASPSPLLGAVHHILFPVPSVLPFVCWLQVLPVCIISFLPPSPSSMGLGVPSPSIPCDLPGARLLLFAPPPPSCSGSGPPSLSLYLSLSCRLYVRIMRFYSGGASTSWGVTFHPLYARGKCVLLSGGYPPQPPTLVAA